MFTVNNYNQNFIDSVCLKLCHVSRCHRYREPYREFTMHIVIKESVTSYLLVFITSKLKFFWCKDLQFVCRTFLHTYIRLERVKVAFIRISNAHNIESLYLSTYVTWSLLSNLQISKSSMTVHVHLYYIMLSILNVATTLRVLCIRNVHRTCLHAPSPGSGVKSHNDFVCVGFFIHCQ